MKSIEEIVDLCLDFWVGNQLNSFPGDVPEEMQTGEISEDWVYWKPIKSTVTLDELKEFESSLGFKLPSELTRVLMYKHFIELHVGNVEIFAMPNNGWQLSISKGLHDSWPSEFLIEKGFLPFAVYSDWGLWCFNLNEADSNGIFPIYQWDHEDTDRLQFISSSLKEALNLELAKNA